MYPRHYPGWEPPEIEEWRAVPVDMTRHCLPLAAAADDAGSRHLFCRPRRHCRPCYGFIPFGFYPYGCAPYLSCTPTYICYPRSCFPIGY